MPTLKNAINRYKDDFKQKVPEHVRQTMLDATDRLRNQNISHAALKVGDHITPFSLLNAINKPINIEEELRTHNYLVLNFYRGAWCPYCNLELRQLQKIQGELRVLHAELLALSPQTADNSLSQIEKENLKFNVLCDKNNAVARKFGLVFTLDEELRPIYEDFGIDILESNKNGTFDLPLPATYVVNKNYEIIYAFVDEDYTNRCEPEAILHAIKEDIKNTH